MARKRNTPKKAVPAKKQHAVRASENTIKRAVELRGEGLGLVKITRQLTEEGHKSATGKELRPQTVRQLLLRALDTDRLREPKEQGE